MKRNLFLLAFMLISCSAYSQKSLTEVFYSQSKVNDKPNTIVVIYSDLVTFTVNPQNGNSQTYQCKLIESGSIGNDRVLLYSVGNTGNKFRLVESPNSGKFFYKLTYISTELGIQKTQDLQLNKL